MTKSALDVNRLLALYNENRFLDAYSPHAWIWEDPAATKDMFSCEELVHLGRLAGRLGGGAAQDIFYQQAIELSPENPLVRYYVRRHKLETTLIEDIRDFEDGPALLFLDEDFQASWYASNACLYAIVRDFDAAHRLLDKARSYERNHAWVASCAADVMFRQDRWDAALGEANDAFERSPHMPAASSILAKILAKKNRIDEINARLMPFVDTNQSFEFLMTVVWYLCVKAERSDEASCNALARKAYDLSNTLETLAPLADEATRQKFQLCRLDIAMLMEDYAAMEHHGEQTDYPFYTRVIDHLRTHPDGKRLVLPFRPVFQKHLTCLPASAATSLGTFDVNIDEDELAHELTYNGTALWRIEQWFHARGFYTRSFIIHPDHLNTLILSGLPVINLTEYTDFSHATVVVGVDERTGTFILHDPSSERLVHVLADRFHESETPFGPVGLVIVTEEKRHLLDLIPATSYAPAACYHLYKKYAELNQPEEAVRVLTDFIVQWPDHASARRFDALRKSDSGMLYQAIEIQRRLLKDYPQCLAALRDLLNNLYRTRNKSLIRKILKNIVTRGKLPGISKHNTWDYPPTTYAAQYANYIGDNAEGFDEAIDCLVKALQTDPFSAEAYHVLGIIHSRKGNYHDAILPLRVASFMDEYQENYAWEACNAYRQVGFEADGLAFLRRRMERLGQKIHGSLPAITYIDALERYGHPDQAIEAMDRCLCALKEDPQLLNCAVDFWIRMGKWDRAAEALDAIGKTEHRILYLSAAATYYRQCGQWQKAFELSETWLNKCPHNIEARTMYLSLYKRKLGMKKALSLQEGWLKEFRNNESIENIYYGDLKALHKNEEQEAFLRKRIHRNPYDIWAWHELGFLILAKADLASGQARLKMLSAMDEVLASIEKIAPEHPVSHALKGDFESSRKKFQNAVRHYFDAIEDDPEYVYCYSRIWEVSVSFSPEDQETIVSRLEEKIFESVGFLHHARSLVFNIAERFGAKRAEAIIGRWAEQRSEDPEIIEARVDLLLNYGQGRSDAWKAVAILEPALERFPNHVDLRRSLARAYEILLKQDEEIEVLREIIRRHPLDSHVRNRLASLWSRLGKDEEAFGLLREGVDFDPLDESGWMNLSGMLWEKNRYGEALDILEEGLHLMPENISLRRMLSQRLLEAGEAVKAVDVLKRGIEIYPDGAYLWYLYADALRISDSHTDTHDMERAYRKALELNHTFFEAADSLAIFLAGQNRFSEARELMRRQIEILDDPTTARGRLVWVKRREGKNREALEEMAEIVRKWPTYTWAWDQLIRWLDEDGEFALAKDILKDVHPVMSDNPRFMADRLILLKRAGIPISQLSAQWDKLLSDFPRYERLHTLWIDQLIKAEDFEGAQRVLGGIERFYPDSPYTHVRRLILHVETFRFDDAVSCALKIWTKPGNDDMWPDAKAWDVIKQAGYVKKSLQALLPVVESGQRVRPEAFRNLVNHLNQLETRPAFVFARAPFKWFFSSGTVLRLRNLLRIVRGTDWDKGLYQAMVLERLIELKDRRYVLSYARQNRQECMDCTAIWQALGRLHLSGRRKDRLFVRKLMAGWRDHQGSEMWAVTNYVICLRRYGGILPLREDLDELYRTTRDLIASVPHDHTIRYIVSAFCAAALRKGYDEEFLAYVGQFEHLLKSGDKRYWMARNFVWLPDVILLFKRMLVESDHTNLGGLTRELKSLLASHPTKMASRWVRKEWLKRIMPRLTWAERIRTRFFR